MQLTKQESEELDVLSNLQQCSDRYLSQQDFDRLKELRTKLISCQFWQICGNKDQCISCVGFDLFEKQH